MPGCMLVCLQVYALLSPHARALAGPLSTFAIRLARMPTYRPLLGHARATHVCRSV